MSTEARAAPAAKPSKQVNMVQALNMALHDAMAEDPTVIVLGEDVADPQGGGVMKVTEGLSTRFGGRVRATPIAEQAIAGAAIGAALAGLRPVAEIMLMNFMTVAMDQVVNHAAKLRFMSGGQTGVPITIRTLSGAGWGLGGQHSDMLEAWFCHTAGLKVVMPWSPAEAYGLLLSAIADDDPVVFIETLPLYHTPGPPPERGRRIPLGRANIVRAGTDVTVIGYGRAVPDALAVSETLAAQGISVEVIDLRTVAPLDMATLLESVGRTRRAVVVHEAVKAYGAGAEIASRLHEQLPGQLLAPVERIGSRSCPVPFSQPLEKAFLYSRDDIAAAVRRTLGKSA